jgi:hypothetical protein
MNDKVMKAASHMQAKENIYFNNIHNSHDGYPNLSEHELNQVQVKEIKWFIDRIGDIIFSASATDYNGSVKIYDQSHAKELCNSQDVGYRFLSLTERVKYSLGAAYKDQSLGFQEPELNKLYRFDFYVNGILKESKEVQYSGLSDNKQYHIFTYTTGMDKAGNHCHLLKVGYFPTYHNRSKGEEVNFEKYTPIN